MRAVLVEDDPMIDSHSGRRGSLEKKQMKYAIAGLLMLLGVAGCATEYQTKGPGGGYTDRQVGPALWRVEITSNNYTRRELIREFAMLRSAELAVRHGYTHFAVVDPQSATAVPRFVEPSADNLVFMFAGIPSGRGPVFEAAAVCMDLGAI